MRSCTLQLRTPQRLGSTAGYGAAPGQQRRRRRCLLARRRLSPSASSADAEGSPTDDLELSFQRALAAQQAQEEYRLQMALPDERLDVLLCTTLIARHRYPLLEHDSIVEQLDDLAVQVAGRLPDTPYPLSVLRAISAHLYGEEGGGRGFRGNKEDFYSPDNSCLNKVLETRRGIPISLGLVYLEVAARLRSGGGGGGGGGGGLHLVGLNIPGHFFLSPADPELEFLIDPFDGEVSFLQDVEATLSRLYQQPIKLNPSFLSLKQPVPPRAFLARWLNNLKQGYAALRRDWPNAHRVNELLRATRPGDIEAVRDAGVFLYQMKRYGECIAPFTEYLARAPADAADADKIRALLKDLGEP